MDVVLKGAGLNDNVEGQVDPTFGAQRVSIRPLEFSPQGGPVGGHFYLSQNTGTVAVSLAAASDLFSMRWTDTRMVCAILSVAFAWGQLAVVTAGNPAGLEAVVTRNFSTDYTTNATTITPGVGTQKARTAVMSQSLFAANAGIKVATTLGMTGAVSTKDTAGIGAGFLNLGAASSGGGPIDLYRHRDPAQHPIILSANEGLVIRSNATNAWPAGATLQLYFMVNWAELPTFDRN